jgi:hypothetical protein
MGKTMGDLGDTYATIKKGKVKMGTKSKQFKFLMLKKLPLTVVKKGEGKKVAERLNVKK